jgi:hypothetical protein
MIRRNDINIIDIYFDSESEAEPVIQFGDFTVTLEVAESVLGGLEEVIYEFQDHERAEKAKQDAEDRLNYQQAVA